VEPEPGQFLPFEEQYINKLIDDIIYIYRKKKILFNLNYISDSISPSIFSYQLQMINKL